MDTNAPPSQIDAVVDVLGDLPGDPPGFPFVPSPIRKCAACQIPFRGMSELCAKCEEESFFCANCGEEKGEFLCRLCIVSKVPHCMVCRRSPLPGGTLCGEDQAQFDKEKIVPAAGIPAVHASDYNTESAFQAEMDRSHAIANPYG